MHYSLCSMLEKESHSHVQQGILKAIFYLITKTPYCKLQYGVISETVLPFIIKHFKAKKQDGYDNKLSKTEIQITQIIRALLSVKELKHELNDCFCWEYFNYLLLPNEENVELLAMIAANYAEIIYQNWSQVKEFLDYVLQINHYKMQLAVLKLLEQWLKNFDKIASTSEDESSKSNRHISNAVAFKSSASSFSKQSEEEKSSTDSHDSDKISFDINKDAQKYKTKSLNDINPLNLEDFRTFLRSTIDWFLTNSDSNAH